MSYIPAPQIRVCRDGPRRRCRFRIAACGGSEPADAARRERVAPRQSRCGAARQPARHHLQVRRRERRAVRRGLSRHDARRRRRRRADVDRRSRSADADDAVEAGADRRVHADVFVPIYPYVGEATLQLGLYSPKTQTRLTLEGEDVGQRAYRAGRLQLQPQSENLFTVFKDGWHPAEVAEHNASVSVAVDQEAGDARVQEPEEGRHVLSGARPPGRRVQRKRSR